jgi:hypothetical protein
VPLYGNPPTKRIRSAQQSQAEGERADSADIEALIAELEALPPPRLN